MGGVYLKLTNPSFQMSTIYISCASGDKQTLGIKLPFLVMIIKNLKKYFSFEVQVPVVFVWMLKI